MLPRTKKQLIIGGIYILVALVVAGGIYWSKYRPTCFDNRQNGKEEGVDCGTLACGKACVSPIQALIIQDSQLVKTLAGDFDLVVGIYNPNVDYGAETVNYDLIISDSGKTEVFRRADSFYILPGQTKNIVRTSLRGIPDGAIPKIDIKSVTWDKLPNLGEINFIVTREASSSSANQTTYEAVVFNDSNFDFDMVDVSVVVLDDSGSVLTTNTTNIQTILSKTERSFKVLWPFELPVGARMQVEVGTNVFKDTNFLKQNGIQEKFQQYY